MPKIHKDKPQMIETILAQVASGRALIDTCRDEGMPAEATFRGWCDSDPDLAARYARARDDRADVIFEQMLVIADTPVLGEVVTIKEDGKTETRQEDMLGHRRLQIEARKWMLGRMSPKKYGDKLELAGDKDNPIVTVIERRIVKVGD